MPGAPVAPPVREVAAAELGQAATTLAAAFADDPVRRYLHGGKEVSVRRREAFFVPFLQMHQRHHTVHCTTPSEAVAVWAPPGAWKVPLGIVLRSTPTFVRVFGARLVNNLAVLAQIEHEHPTAPHWYLEFLGTGAALRGRGHGGALLAEMAERADREGVGMYLENSNEVNLGFYHRFGFTTTQVLRLRRGGPPMWLMWRDPT